MRGAENDGARAAHDDTARIGLAGGANRAPMAVARQRLHQTDPRNAPSGEPGSASGLRLEWVHGSVLPS